MAFPGLQLLSENTQSTNAELAKYKDSAIFDSRFYIKCFGSWNNYWKNTWNLGRNPIGKYRNKEIKRKQGKLLKWSVWFKGWQVVPKGCFTFYLVFLRAAQGYPQLPLPWLTTKKFHDTSLPLPLGAYKHHSSMCHSQWVLLLVILLSSCLLWEFY